MDFATPLTEISNNSAICDKVIYLSSFIMSLILSLVFLTLFLSPFLSLFTSLFTSLPAFCPETEPRRNVNSTRSVLGPKCSLSGIIMTALFFYISALLLLDSPGLSFLKNPCQSAVEYGAGDYVIGYISPTCPLSLLMYAEPNKSLRCLAVSWLVGAF